MVKLILKDGIKLNNPVIIEGFPGIGMVGTIVATYLIEKMNMEEIGYFKSEMFPPVVAIHNSKPHNPARIYASPDGKFVVILSEFVIPFQTIYRVANDILDFANKFSAERIVSVGGIAISPQISDQRRIFGIGTTDELNKLLESHNIEIINDGAISNVSAIILSEYANMGKQSYILLVESMENFPDPKGAVEVINTLEKIEDFDIDTSDLEKEAASIQKRIKDAIEQAKRAQRSYKEIETSPLYG